MVGCGHNGTGARGSAGGFAEADVYALDAGAGKIIWTASKPGVSHVFDSTSASAFGLGAVSPVVAKGVYSVKVFAGTDPCSPQRDVLSVDLVTGRPVGTDSTHVGATADGTAHDDTSATTHPVEAQAHAPINATDRYFVIWGHQAGTSTLSVRALRGFGTAWETPLPSPVVEGEPALDWLQTSDVVYRVGDTVYVAVAVDTRHRHCKSYE
jgi:hypothetical protein